MKFVVSGIRPALSVVAPLKIAGGGSEVAKDVPFRLSEPSSLPIEGTARKALLASWQEVNPFV